MAKDTLIFDLDGTLLNTLGDLHTCFNHAIKTFGYPERTIEEIQKFVGNGIKIAIKRAISENITDEELNKITEYFKTYYKEHMFELTKPYEGILETLRVLYQQKYKLGIVSNKYDDAVKKLCKNYFGEYIKTAIGEGYGIEKKPAPDGVLKAIEELNSTVENTIYIGDSDVDILTAKNTGVPCISVLWGFRDKEFLEKSGAKYFAKTPNDIIKIIEKKLYLI